MKRLFIALGMLGSAAVAAPQAELAKGKQIAEQVCAACHAADGNSNIAAYPRLAGQHHKFIFKQTKDIKEGKRTTGAAASMMAAIQQLSDDDIRNVAAFYAAQQARPGETNPKANPQLGAKIFRGGLPEKKIPACMACHSPNGAGIPAGGTEVTAYPRLSGQHADYVVEQLKAYAADKRTGNMMRDIAKRMSEEDMKAVANFIQGLH
ncbi:c-type cytochrome [Conchiformibius kuhniae]|uniref:C-type cytochrome n=1 Tax=Conchiformibius kuhniae TaxID=211502 RepID=A0ABD8B741_9NEIS|nr:c-type cytochrome [Conchiformibius kuhniae]